MFFSTFPTLLRVVNSPFLLGLWFDVSGVSMIWACSIRSQPNMVGCFCWKKLRCISAARETCRRILEGPWNCNWNLSLLFLHTIYLFDTCIYIRCVHNWVSFLQGWVEIACCMSTFLVPTILSRPQSTPIYLAAACVSISSSSSPTQHTCGCSPTVPKKRSADIAHIAVKDNTLENARLDQKPKSHNIY